MGEFSLLLVAIGTILLCKALPFNGKINFKLGSIGCTLAFFLGPLLFAFDQLGPGASPIEIFKAVGLIVLAGIIFLSLIGDDGSPDALGTFYCLPERRVENMGRGIIAVIALACMGFTSLFQQQSAIQEYRANALKQQAAHAKQNKAKPTRTRSLTSQAKTDKHVH